MKYIRINAIIRVPEKDATPEEVLEWIKYRMCCTAKMKLSHPLVDEELNAVEVDMVGLIYGEKSTVRTVKDMIINPMAGDKWLATYKGITHDITVTSVANGVVCYMRGKEPYEETIVKWVLLASRTLQNPNVHAIPAPIKDGE